MVMVRDPHRPRIEVEALIERGGLGGALLFADCAAPDGEDATAGPGARLEHAAVVADLPQLVCRGHPGESGAENDDPDAGDLAGQLERSLGRRGEQAETGHRLVHERGPACCPYTGQEQTPREIHTVPLMSAGRSAVHRIPRQQTSHSFTPGFRLRTRSAPLPTARAGIIELEQAEGLAGADVHAGRVEADVLAVQHVQHFDEQRDAARAPVERAAERERRAARSRAGAASLRVSLTKYCVALLLPVADRRHVAAGPQLCRRG